MIWVIMWCQDNYQIWLIPDFSLLAFMYEGALEDLCIGNITREDGALEDLCIGNITREDGALEDLCIGNITREDVL